MQIDPLVDLGLGGGRLDNLLNAPWGTGQVAVRLKEIPGRAISGMHP